MDEQKCRTMNCDLMISIAWPPTRELRSNKQFARYASVWHSKALYKAKNTTARK